MSNQVEKRILQIEVALTKEQISLLTDNVTSDILLNLLSNIDIESISLLKKDKDKRIKNKQKDNELVRLVIDYLNEQLGTRYTATQSTTIKNINGRAAEGYTLDDFKRVIDLKFAEWKDNPKMRRFLRPGTLFTPSKFESYVNEAAMQEGAHNSQQYGRMTREEYEQYFGQNQGKS